MRIALVCVGRLKAGPERELFDRYFKRLRHSAQRAGIAGIDLREIDESRARRVDDRRSEEAGAILAAVPGGGLLVALDERGRSPTSAEWASDIGRARDDSRPAYALAIGVPARQIGWMSRFGRQLDLPLEGNGRARCDETGELYVLRDGVCSVDGTS